jgi:thymidylate kinase
LPPVWKNGGSGREPGGTAIGEAIRHLLQHSEDNHAMTPETELLLFEASHSQLVREKIQPALRRGEWVSRDRMEEESDEFHARVIRVYRELAENEPRRVILIVWANLAGYDREPNLEYICSTLSRPRKTADSKDQTSNTLNVFLR